SPAAKSARGRVHHEDFASYLVDGDRVDRVVLRTAEHDRETAQHGRSLGRGRRGDEIATGVERLTARGDRRRGVEGAPNVGIVLEVVDVLATRLHSHLLQLVGDVCRRLEV